MDGQCTQWCRKIAENSNCLSSEHERYKQTDELRHIANVKVSLCSLKSDVGVWSDASTGTRAASRWRSKWFYVGCCEKPKPNSSATALGQQVAESRQGTRASLAPAKLKVEQTLPRTGAPRQRPQMTHRTNAPLGQTPVRCRTDRENIQECQQSHLSVYILLTCDVWGIVNQSINQSLFANASKQQKSGRLPEQAIAQQSLRQKDRQYTFV